MRHVANGGFGPGDDGDGAALYGLRNEVLTIEQGALERAEHAAALDLAMVDRKARHFGIRIDLGDIPQSHAGSVLARFLLLGFLHVRQHFGHVRLAIHVGRDTEHRCDPANGPAHDRRNIPASSGESVRLRR